MAFLHHHHRHNHHHQNPTPITITAGGSGGDTCCCCSTPACNAPPSPLPPADPLLHSLISSHLPQYPSYSPYINALHNPINLRHQKHQLQRLHHDEILASLPSRIEALESSLSRFSAPSASCFCRLSSFSLRDLAARTIQTHFRAYLVRRSRTLRHLQDLALIKSNFISLKALVSSEDQFDFEAVSCKAMDLLLKLDSIQGGDPMIRDGKRSISRELARFLEFIEETGLRRPRESIKFTRSVRLGQNKNKTGVYKSKVRDLGRDQTEKEKIKMLKERVERIRKHYKIYQDEEEEDAGLEVFKHVSDNDEEEEEELRVILGQGKNKLSRIPNGNLVMARKHALPSRGKKNVSFADNENVRIVYRTSQELVSPDEACLDGSISSDDQREVENLCNEVEKISSFAKKDDESEEASRENEDSPQSSDGRRIRVMNLSNGGIEETGKDGGKFVFSAPLPLKMEHRADLINRKPAKNVR